MKNKEITDKLGELFHLVYQYEKMGLETNQTDCLTPSEMHFVESIGLSQKMTSKKIGEVLDITKGAVSQQLSKLTKSGYVTKEMSKEDRRKSYIKLTEKGLACYEEHQAIKLNFDELLTQKLNEEEIVGFVKGLSELNHYLGDQIEQETKNER